MAVMCIAFVVVIHQSSAFAASKSSTENQTIPNNVYIGTVSVAGMTQQEAVTAVNNYINGFSDVDITLQSGDKSITVKAKDLGLTWGNTQVAQQAAGIGKSGNLIKRYKENKDLEKEAKVFDITYTLAPDKVKSVLNKNASSLNQEAQNASLTRANGAFNFVEGKNGVKVDVDASVAEIEKFFTKNWAGKAGSVALVKNEVQPQGNQESLSKVKDVLGSFHTNFSTSTKERKANIKVAASKINGTVIYPGDEFSVYKAIGPLEGTNGYELAGAYENGVTVQAYGGGVCQVSTTLYNAALLAEMNITQRSNHSMLVTYVDPSRDAAIAGTYKDLKFQNNTKAPVYIEGYTTGNDLYFTIYGQETRPANRVVTYQSEVTSEDAPIIQVVADGAPVGTISTTQPAHIGKTARLWKIVTLDGVEQSREIINTSKYKSSPKIITVGTASADPNATATINAAIATQDEATVRSVAGQYSAANAAAVAAAQAQLDASAAAAAAAASTVVPAN